jgi:ketosteroid isomerase-like protein
VSTIEEQARAAYAEFVGARDEAEAQRLAWGALADFYTEDGVTLDPVWGRIEGREEIRAYCERSMSGLTGYGWWSRENWTMCEGHRLVSQWDQILGTKDDGTEWMVPCASILYYAGDGLFAYEYQMVNVAHIDAVLQEMGWQPNADLNPPPRHPNRDSSLPVAWKHLEATGPI